MTRQPSFDLGALADPLEIVPIGAQLDAVVRLPGSKSITNRALVCAALAAGTSRLSGALIADDTEAMLAVLGALGIGTRVIQDGATPVLEIDGCNSALPSSSAPIDVRQSGTTARFALPMLSLGAHSYNVTAHPQMQARPMGETFAALRSLGATIEETNSGGYLPASITGANRSGTITVAGDISSQFLSGLLLSAPCRPDGLEIHLSSTLVSRPYVDMTIAVMAAFGAKVHVRDERTFIVEGGGYSSANYEIEPDASAASYIYGAAAVVGGRATVVGLGSDALQGDAGFVDVLEQMGVSVARSASETTVEMRTGARLVGGEFDFTHISDTAQTLAAISVFADSPVSIRGIGFIRRKEIDRIAAIEAELRRASINVVGDEDGWTIHPGRPVPTTFETYEDHRMAMSLALIGLREPGFSISGPGCVAKTFPGYWATLELLRRSAHDR